MTKKTWLNTNNLRRERDREGWSQAELAERLGVRQQHVSRWENGDIDPSPEMLVRIAQVFGVTVDYLLGLSTERTGKAEVRANPDLKELLAQAVNEGNAAEALEIIAGFLKRKQ